MFVTCLILLFFTTTILAEEKNHDGLTIDNPSTTETELERQFPNLFSTQTEEKFFTNIEILRNHIEEVKQEIFSIELDNHEQLGTVKQVLFLENYTVPVNSNSVTKEESHIDAIVIGLLILIVVICPVIYLKFKTRHKRRQADENKSY